MSSEARSTVGLLDLAAKLPSMITEVPILARGAAGLTRKPSAKESIGLIFQKAAHAHPSRPFIRFEGHASELIASTDHYVKEYLYKTRPPW